MTAASDLWASVVAAYDAGGLVTLTNIRDRAATTINTTAGEAAAQEVIDLWDIYAQAAYDEADAKHLAVARQAVVAMLWRRGGTASAIEQVKWEEVFGDDGLLSKIKRTGSRSRSSPTSNSGVKASSELDASGRQQRPWSDPGAVPRGMMPSTRPVDF